MKKFIKKIVNKYISPTVLSGLQKDQTFSSVYEYMKDNIKNLSSLNQFNKHPEQLFYEQWGYAKSTKNLTTEEKMQIFLHFQYSEKAKVALSVASSYPGGHYLEFGSHDLYTLRNFLGAFDVGNLNSKYPNTKFYGFDIFGSYSNENLFEKGKTYENSKNYFDDFTHQGDMIPAYEKLLKEFDVFNDRTFLIKGFFEDTIKNFELDDKIGFVCLDCNIVQSYEFVLDWLEDKVSDGTYMYFDEYFDGSAVNQSIENFRDKLLNKYKIKLHYVRSAASVGALFRCFKV
jgi:hypothetical protein